MYTKVYNDICIQISSSYRSRNKERHIASRSIGNLVVVLRIVLVVPESLSLPSLSSSLDVTSAFDSTASVANSLVTVERDSTSEKFDGEFVESSADFCQSEDEGKGTGEDFGG